MNIEDLNKELEELSKEDKLELKPKQIKGLSDDQTKALAALNEWIYRVHKNKDEQNFFSLRGSAGTGKTTLIDTFLKEIKHPYRNSRICICAPTHKAKRVIQEKTGWKNSETLQALLGLKLDVSIEDFDINNPAFNPIGDRKIRDYDLVIVDESSMINAELYNALTECARTTGTKILFVGDIKQLNPVKEYGISPSLITPVNGYELTQIVRQNNTNPLILLLDALRYDIENGTSTYLDLLKAKPENTNDLDEGYLVCDAKTFSKYVNNGFTSEEFKQDRNHCRYISWTNQSITDTNKWIRNNTFGYLNSTLELGEILLSYGTVVKDDYTVIVNSEDYIVEKIEDEIIKIADYEQTMGVIEIKTLFVHIRGIDSGRLSKVNILFKELDNYINYSKVFNEKLNHAKNARSGRVWGKFYEFKNLILKLADLNQNGQLLVKKDIDYGYGITIHKSQGSTHTEVYVNGKDINKNINDIERKRLWYVALSRASKKVYINL